MEEKKFTGINENELEAVAGGAAGDSTQIKLASGAGGGFYRCCFCGTQDFYVIGETPSIVQVRCKNCGQVSQVSQV